jgi:hypothetical protein
MALIQESLVVAHKTGALAIRDLERVVVDITVQPKAIAHPTDERLCHSALEKLVDLRGAITCNGAELSVRCQARRDHGRALHACPPVQAGPARAQVSAHSAGPRSTNHRAPEITSTSAFLHPSMILCEPRFESTREFTSMRAMPFLQLVNGKYRVRIVVPPELRPNLPPPHTGKTNLTRALGTGNEPEANRLAVPWIADFQAAITSAASITENPHGYDCSTRYRAYHRGQNRLLPEARLFPPHPALALSETKTKPVPFDRMILLWAKQTSAPKQGNQDMEAKCGRFAEWLGHDDMARVGFENAGITATR